MPKIKVNGVELNYEIRGKGPNLIFINGIGADMKNPIGLFNSPMIEHFAILSFDPRGLGESESPEIPCSMGDLADDAAALAKAVGWDRYNVFGASMGGMIAQELAIKYPEAVDKLVLAVTNPGGDCGAPVIVDKMLDLSPIEMLKTSDIRQDEEWAKTHPEMLEKMAIYSDTMKAAMENDSYFKRGYMNQVAAVLGHDTTKRLKEIKADTLFFNGRYDGSIPISAAERLNAIPNSRFEIVDHGHGSWFFDPKVWNMVIDFLKEV